MDQAAEHDRLIQRVLQLKNALDAGADPLWVDYGCNVAVRRYLETILPGLGLPSNAILRALGDTVNGARPAYLNRPRGHRAALEHRLHLMAGVAFAMDMLITTHPIVFQPSAAAKLIADKLNAADIPPLGGKGRREDWRFTEAIVAKWHDHVVKRATSWTPERQMFDALANNPARRPPEQRGWDQERRENERKAWVDRFIAGSRNYFRPGI